MGGNPAEGQLWQTIMEKYTLTICKGWSIFLYYSIWFLNSAWCVGQRKGFVWISTSERSSLPSKNFPCISMDMLQIGALVLLGRLVEAIICVSPLADYRHKEKAFTADWQADGEMLSGPLLSPCFMVDNNGQAETSYTDSVNCVYYLQTPKKETFHPEILKKSNHILRNCKNAD